MNIDEIYLQGSCTLLEGFSVTYKRQCMSAAVYDWQDSFDIVF